MPHLRVPIGSIVVFAAFARLVSAQVGSQTPLTCNTNAGSPPVLRGEGFTELTADIVISCTGGVPIQPGGNIPLVNIAVFYNATVTSRLFSTIPQTSASTSEALLLIDEPGSGLPSYGSSLPQTLCNTPFGCAVAVGAVAGPTYGTAVLPGTATPAPNVYQGVISNGSNSTVFYGVPILPPGGNNSRVFRITNVRVNANALASAASVFPVLATISVSGSTSLAIQNPNFTVGYVLNGLSASAENPANFNKYSGQAKTSATTLKFSENYGTAFKTRVFAQSNNLYAGQINNPVQNVPGAIYNSESSFVLPLGGGQVAGLADFGTRLKATFDNIPGGMRVFVSTANVIDNASPVLAPNPVGGIQANSSTGYAVLVNSEGTSDGDAGGGAFPAMPSTDMGPGGSGAVPITELNISNGTATAVWEVVNTNPNIIESLKFGVYVTYAANSPGPGSSTVSLGMAATAATGVAADAGSPLPRFGSSPNSALPAFSMCATASCLAIASTHSGSFTQGQSNAVYTVTVSNQAGANPTSGTVAVTEAVPAGLTLVSMAGDGWQCPTNVCTRNDALSGGASYPAITVTANVAADAPPLVTNQVIVAGGGSGTVSAIDPTTVINLSPPLLAITKSHTGFFLQGQAGANYMVTVSNHVGAGPTSGTVTVTETVPAGLTLVSMLGSGWLCIGNTCTRSDTLAGGESYPLILVTVNVAANAASPQGNTVTVSGGGAQDANFTDSTLIAGGGLLACYANVAVAPLLRGEGYTEQTGDITLTCSQGTPPAPGSAIPAVNITITYNSNVTSRLLPTTSPQASDYTSEALLLIDEPGSGLAGYGPSLPQVLCTTPLTGCQAYVGAAAGSTYGTAVSSGSTPAPNVYQGVVNGNSVTFYGVPVLSPGSGWSRVFRITNVRVNAQPLAAGLILGAAPVIASIAASGAGAMPIWNAQPTAGYALNGVATGVHNATVLGQCSSQTRTSAASLTFTENFGTAFKTRAAAVSNALYAGQIKNPAQNIPGAIWNSESNFVFPVNASQIAGLTDFGTRLKATFNNIPAGTRIFVSTANVNNDVTPAAVPGPIGGSQGNNNVMGNYVGYAQLVNGESTNDGDAAIPGIFPAVAPTAYGPNNGNVPIAEILVVNGVGTAVWEVVNTNPSAIESLNFAVYVTYTANLAQNSPAPGTATVNLSYAATAGSGVAADAAIPTPRFASDSAAARAVFTIGQCALAASLLTPTAGTTLPGTSASFSWNLMAGADQYWLDVGTSLATGDIWAGALTTSSKLVSGLPCDGRTIYAQLYTHTYGAWLSPQRSTFTAPTCGAARITSPTPGSTLSSTSADFAWNVVSGADQYWLDVGNSIAVGDIWAGALMAAPKTVSGLPCDGRTIHVQLYTHLGGAWLPPQRYTYVAPTGCSGTSAQISSPVPGTVLAATAATFAWSAASGADQYWLDVGNGIGVGDIWARRPHFDIQVSERPPLRWTHHSRAVVYSPQRRLAIASALHLHRPRRLYQRPDLGAQSGHRADINHDHLCLDRCLRRRSVLAGCRQQRRDR